MDINVQRAYQLYLDMENLVSFVKAINKSTAKAVNLLGSKSVADVLEAIDLLRISTSFKLDDAEVKISDNIINSLGRCKADTFVNLVERRAS